MNNSVFLVCGSLHSSSVAQCCTARLWLIAQLVCGLLGSLHSSSLGYGVNSHYFLTPVVVDKCHLVSRLCRVGLSVWQAHMAMVFFHGVCVCYVYGEFPSRDTDLANLDYGQ